MTLHKILHQCHKVLRIWCGSFGTKFDSPTPLSLAITKNDQQNSTADCTSIISLRKKLSGKTYSTFSTTKKKNIQSRRIFPLPVPMPLSSSPALLLRIHEQSPPAAETQCKLPATNSNAQECQYPLARCAFHMYVRGEETQKVSICDYSLV